MVRICPRSKSLDVYIQYQELESKLRLIQGFSYRLYDETANTVVFAVSVEYLEKVAYALSHSPSDPLQPITVNLKDGEWRVAFSLDNDAIKRELNKYAINQKQNEGKSAEDFIRTCVVDNDVREIFSCNFSVL